MKMLVTCTSAVHQLTPATTALEQTAILCDASKIRIFGFLRSCPCLIPRIYPVKCEAYLTGAVDFFFDIWSVPTIATKIKHPSTKHLLLFKEGLFWVAYEQSAYFIAQHRGKRLA